MKKNLDILDVILNNPISDKSLLFLDGIQAMPEAIPALRYFYGDPQNN